MNSYFRISVLTLALVLIAPTSALADKIVMKNGDVITGNITLITDEDIYVEPAYADEYRLDTAEVLTVELEEEFEVELADESKMDGRLAVNEAGEQVLIVGDTMQDISLSELAEASEPEAYFDWGLNVDFSAAVNEGNTDSANSLLYAAGNVKIGDHRQVGDLTFSKDETNGVQTKDQVRFNYAYNWMFNDPWFFGGSFTYERDPIRELDYRYTLGAIAGRDIFDDARKFMNFSIGLGYSDEEIGGVTESGTVGLWTFRYDHEFWDGVQFFHNNGITYQAYGENNVIVKTNTGFRFDLIDDLYANISYRYDYETEPAPDRESRDTTLSMGLGYEF